MKPQTKKQTGFSLLELLAVVSIMGIIALLVIPRIGGSTQKAKANICYQFKGELNAAIDRFYFDNNVWPDGLDDLGEYFPDGVPTICPAVNLPYAIDADAHRILGHEHDDL